MYYGFGFDSTYILVLIGVVICLAASSKMNATFRKYARVQSHNGLTGREAAERILRSQGIYDVRVDRVAGNLTDHYDPRNKVLRLSNYRLHALSSHRESLIGSKSGQPLPPLSSRSCNAPLHICCKYCSGCC